MNFPAILDVGLGLVVVFFLLATICSILVEIIAGRKEWRHNALKTAINALLRGHETSAKTHSMAGGSTETPADRSSEDAISRFWDHPEIEPLRADDAKSPGYLDSTRFATVVLDIATGLGADGAIPDSRAAFSRAFGKHAPPKLRARLDSLLRNLPAGTLEVRAAITAALAQWFEEAMAHTTGGYKRKVQIWLFWIGLAAALTLNCDTLRISYVLFRDPGLRSSMVDYAKSLGEPLPSPANPPTAVGTNLAPAFSASTNFPALADLQSALRVQIKELQKLERIGFPIGWVAPPDSNFLPFSAEAKDWGWWIAAVLLKCVGLLSTGLAVCLGAPFWFDVLNKLLKLRGGDAKSGPDSRGGRREGESTPPQTSGSASGNARATATEASPQQSRPLAPIDEALRDPVTQFSAGKAYWLAEASLLAYSERPEIETKVTREWLCEFTPLEDPRTNTQGFLAIGRGVAILAFRGTEPAQLPDWRTDANALLKPFKDADGDWDGQLHTGFMKAFEGIRGQLKEALAKLPGSGALLYVTGHSLGGALATLSAYRVAKLSTYAVQGVYTFGCPRVGNADFAKACQALTGAQTFRVVNNEDLVTRVPPRSAGYEHVGELIYIDDAGRLQRDIGFWYRFLNLLANAAEDFWKAAKTTVRDHSMGLYCEHLKRAATSRRTDSTLTPSSREHPTPQGP